MTVVVGVMKEGWLRMDRRQITSEKLKEKNENLCCDSFEFKLSEKFKTGQSYVDTVCIQYVCKKCGGDKFYVGSSKYYTAIVCPNCKWEECIHDG